MLRRWLQAHAASPLFFAVERSLRAREAEAEAQAAREREAQARWEAEQNAALAAEQARQRSAQETLNAEHAVLKSMQERLKERGILTEFDLWVPKSHAQFASAGKAGVVALNIMPDMYGKLFKTVLPWRLFGYDKALLQRMIDDEEAYRLTWNIGVDIFRVRVPA
jgi:hypothetical protein